MGDKMESMNKKITTIYVLQDSIDGNILLDELLDILNKAKTEGGIDVDIESEYESSTVSISISYDREETDQECADREAKEKEEAERRMLYKRKEFERLKKELGE